MLRMLGSKYLNPVKAAAIVILGYHAFQLILTIFVEMARGYPIDYLFGFGLVVTIVLQMAFAVVIFYKIQADEDSYMAYLGWGALGLVLIFYVAPEIVKRLPV